jgi:hypothetical protein
MGEALKEVTKQPPKKAALPKSQSGGSNDIKVQSKLVVIPQEDKAAGQDVPEEGAAESRPGDGGTEEDFNSDEVKGAVIAATAKVIGKAMVLLTKFPDMDFTPEEVESLKEIWIPVMPSMSPTMMALVGTVVILGSKLAVYMVRKGEAGGKQASTAPSS